VLAVGAGTGTVPGITATDTPAGRVQVPVAAVHKLMVLPVAVVVPLGKPWPNRATLTVVPCGAVGGIGLTPAVGTTTWFRTGNGNVATVNKRTLLGPRS